MKRLLILVPIIVSGCSSFDLNTNLDKENFDEYFKASRVEIFTQAQLNDLNSLYLGVVEGYSCQANLNEPRPNIRQARTLARQKVADMGGNGIVFDSCPEFVDTPGCLKQIICYGQALKVAKES